MGRDLLTKLRAKITFNPDGPQVEFLNPSKSPLLFTLKKKKEIAQGVITQTLGPWKRPVAYLSKRLDPVASGWPHCLKAIAAAALLIKDADKLTLGQKLTIIAPHALENIIRQPPDRWLSNSRITHYQSLLLDKDRITLGPPAPLNPATLLPEESSEPVIHGCQHILAEETSIRQDLKDQPLPHPEVVWFTDGSSFLQDGEQQSGDLTVLEYPGNLTPEDTETELLDSTGPSLQFQKALHYVKDVHQLTHLGSKKLQAFLKDQEQKFPLTSTQRKEIAKRFFVDTFSGWVEAFPTKKETAQVVIKKILEDIFPRFGLPKVIGSNNGPAFVAQT
ncbi:uncharacterized protein LOC124086518 [Marmota monax]|uniref:uncharacterized protein LOC124086518 n=1 Tax=Marmota monax TaxID=9995 RepID=UPI0026EFB3F4|nr:uncharacterized protein LOC124086518 [Marmota monax]